MKSTLPTFPGRQKYQATLATVVAIVMTGVLFVSPASAGQKKQQLTISVVAKTAHIGELYRAAQKQDAVLQGAVEGNAALQVVTKSVEIKPDDYDHTVEELVKGLTKSKAVLWAVPNDTPVRGSRFHAWPAGRPLRAGQDLSTILPLEEIHQLATGAGVRIAVLDTGFDEDHPLLANRLSGGADLLSNKTNTGELRDRIDNDGDGEVDEAFGHGTYVAGIIAQVAPDSLIVPFRVLDADGSGELHNVVDAIDRAIDAQVDVINMSFGTPFKSKPLEEAIKHAQKRGIVVVAASGNTGVDDHEFPAAFSQVLGVGAYDQNAGGLAPFGTYGKWVDVAAPGVKIRSSRPGGAYGAWSGSSMAAPIVAAQAALLIERGLSKRSEMRKFITDSAIKSSSKRRTNGGSIDIVESLRKVK